MLTQRLAESEAAFAVSMFLEVSFTFLQCHSIFLLRLIENVLQHFLKFSNSTPRRKEEKNDKDNLEKRRTLHRTELTSPCLAKHRFLLPRFRKNVE